MAEVKVKITAQNEVQTGLQASLAEVRQFAGQAQKEMQSAFEPRRIQAERVAPTFGPIDIGDYGMEPLKKLQEEARKLRESAQAGFDDGPPQKFGSSIAGVLGRMALLVAGGATVGKIVASAFDQLSDVMRSAIGIQEQFNNALEQAGQATSFEGAISAFKQLNALADQTGKTLEKAMGRNIGEALANAFSGRPGQLLARLGDVATGGAVSSEIGAQEEQQRRLAQDTLRTNMAFSATEAEEMIATGGDPEEMARVQREQEKRRQMETLRSTFADGKGGEFSEAAQQAEAALKEQQALEDQVIAVQRLARAKAQAAAEADQTATAGMSTEQRLEKEKQAMAELQAEQEKFASAAAMQPADATGGLTEAAARYYELQEQIEQSKQRQISLEESLKREAERAAEAAQRDAERAEKEEERKREKAADFNQNTELMEARASGDKGAEEAILREQDLEKGLEATGNLEDATRFADAAAALRQQQGAGGQSGSFGASSLQRIGFASNEFFDTRRSDDTATQIKSVGTVVKEIGQLLKKENVLLMKSEF
jgi:colicin import membrane protein